MESRKGLNERVRALKNKGVRFGVQYSQSDLRAMGKLQSAESEITIAELIGGRYSIWGGITIQPRYLPPTDVDLDIRDQGAQFSVQVKTFTFLQSKYERRTEEAIRNWDAMLPEGENAYVAKTFRGTDVVYESIRPVKGVERLARVGAFRFEPSPHDLRQMNEKIIDCLSEVYKQLCDAPGFRVALFDVRYSYIDSETLYTTVNDIMPMSELGSSVNIVGMLTYNYEQGPLLKPITAPLWIQAGYEKAASLFRPPQPVRLVRTRPFVMPLHVYHDKPGWHNLFTLEQGIIKVDDVPYGSPFMEVG